MREYLLFRLHGPMASWGDIAVGEYRPSYGHPSRSAVLGLIAAALGLRREEEDAHRLLASSYGFGVRVDAPGHLLRDYHTAQVPSSGTGKNRRRFLSRREELVGPKEELNTILSTRDYRCGGLYTTVLWPIVLSPPYAMEALTERLRHPVFALHLGRKSCPPALPLQPTIVFAETLRDALTRASFRDGGDVASFSLSGEVPVFWDGEETQGFEKVQTVPRCDQPESRERWQFSNRREHRAVMTSTAGREEAACT